MAEIDVLNRLVIPIAFTLMVIFANYHRKGIEKYLKKKKKRPLLFFIDGFRIEPGNWRHTVAAPLFIALFLALIMDLCFTWLHQPFVSYGEPVWFSSLTSGLLNPISEEFVFRGFLLSFLVFLAMYTVKPYTKKTDFRVGMAALLVISFFFALGHPNSTVFDFAARFMLGLLCGMLYVLSGRNLLPPVVAHAAWNWYLIAKGVL